MYSLVASMLANSGVPLTKARFLCGFKGGGKHGSKNSAPPKLLQVGGNLTRSNRVKWSVS